MPMTRRPPCSRCSTAPGNGAREIEGLSVRGPSLEDVFLKLTGREFRE